MFSEKVPGIKHNGIRNKASGIRQRHLVSGIWYKVTGMRIQGIESSRQRRGQWHY